MPCAVRISDSDHQVRIVEREVIVSAIPEHHITTVRIILCSAQDSFIINAGIDYVTAYNMRFVLFHLLNRALMLLQVFNHCKTLNLLLNKITVRHRVAHCHNLEAFLHEKFNNPA